jgi:hypothetical protein
MTMRQIQADIERLVSPGFKQDPRPRAVEKHFLPKQTRPQRKKENRPPGVTSAARERVELLGRPFVVERTATMQRDTLQRSIGDMFNLLYSTDDKRPQGAFVWTPVPRIDRPGAAKTPATVITVYWTYEEAVEQYENESGPKRTFKGGLAEDPPKLPPPRLLMTAGVNARVADDEPFAKHVTSSIRRFQRNDWGDSDSEDWKENDKALESLNTGGWYGRILASYGEGDSRIWIIRQTTDEDGRQSTTIMFPSEY